MNTQTNSGTRHISVLLKESIDGLDVQKGDVYLDGTLGGAGHMLYALEKTNGEITAIGLDRDSGALERASHILNKFPSVKLECVNFSQIDAVLDEHGIAFVDKILLDLGMSSDQLDQSGRGFSLRKDEPLIMTLADTANQDQNEPLLTAEEIVNTWPEDELAEIIWKYGEEKFSRRIAKAIVEARDLKPIKTTTDLVEVIKKATPLWYHHMRLHPATRTFQALRIAVNDELGSLNAGMEAGFNRLSKGGRMAIISFHSLEDRAVKQFYKAKQDSGQARLVNKKPIVPSKEECDSNPRSRSAKLRILEKI